MMFDLVFDLFPVFFLIMFAVVFIVLISTAVKAVREKKANDASPVLEVEAAVTAKRAHVSSAARSGGPEDLSARSFHTRTAYYATFQVHSGDRMEFQVKETDYGQLAEGDRGTLTFQGTRYLGFQRKREEVSHN